MKETWMIELGRLIDGEGWYGLNGKRENSPTRAMPFDSQEEAVKVAKTIKHDVWCVHRIDDEEPHVAFHARRREVILKAKSLFGLSARTPYKILADRYEEEGMDEEANLLRTTRYTHHKDQLRFKKKGQ